MNAWTLGRCESSQFLEYKYKSVGRKYKRGQDAVGRQTGTALHEIVNLKGT